MATESRRTDADLGDPAIEWRIAREPHRFGFFQAVRLLERAARKPVGEDESPRAESVRFHVPATLAFPAGEIASFAPGEDGGPPEMSVPVLGLIGPAGVLPRHYTQLVIERGRQKDSSLHEFLNLFQHRLLSLFYRAWRKFRFFVGYERAADTDRAGQDDFTHALYGLVGFGTAGLRSRHEFADETLLFYAGHFAHAPRNASALANMLTDYFGLSVSVNQFVGQWLSLRREDQTRLTEPGATRSANNQLGTTAVAGDRVWGVEQKFRVRLGPLSFADFARFVPSGDRLQPASQLIRTYVGPELDFELQPVLRAAEVPRCQLGAPDPPPRLGWTTWLLSQPAAHDADDAIFVAEGWSELPK